MKIVHDQERYDDVVAKLRLIYDSIDELSGTMGDISEKLYSFKMEEHQV